MIAPLYLYAVRKVYFLFKKKFYLKQLYIIRRKSATNEICIVTIACD